MGIEISDLSEIISEMEELYLNDKRPWIVGFSGGKDSTCVTQLVFHMLMGLSPEKRNKVIHIISSNTLVESPLIDRRIGNSLSNMEKAVAEMNLPIIVKRLRPILDDTFWVNLIGRGYPSPNRWFRWCTDRLKIRPANRYIQEQVKQNGEVIILLGARKSESATRAQTLGKYEIPDFKLRSHVSIPGAFVYTPIEELNLRDIFAYLSQTTSPWGDNNRDLLTLYGNVDGECPMVIDTNTSPCGRSRFGCWVCTVVSKDRATEGLIEDGETWLKPLLKFRNWIKQIRDDPSGREGIRRSERRKEIVSKRFGREFKPEEHGGHKILGPFTLEMRHEILRRLIQTQQAVSKRELSLITAEELKAIGTLWIYDGDDPRSITNILRQLDHSKLQETPVITRHSKNEVYLKDICEQYKVPVQLIERLLTIEEDFSTLSKKMDIYSRLEKAVEEQVYSEIRVG